MFRLFIWTALMAGTLQGSYGLAIWSQTTPKTTFASIKNCPPPKKKKIISKNIVSQCDQIGQNFAIQATSYLTNFQLNKQFQHMVCCKYFKVSAVSGLKIQLIDIFGHFLPIMGKIIFNYLVTLLSAQVSLLNFGQKMNSLQRKNTFHETNSTKTKILTNLPPTFYLPQYC